VVALVLLTCFACPIFEAFDRWDHTLKTGQDTESSFAVLAFCAGAIISFVLSAAIANGIPDLPTKQSYVSSVPLFDFAMVAREFTAVSQSPPPLRI